MRPELGICKREKGATTKELNDSMLLLLPTHLILDILARLPVYTIYTCKRVCNTFRTILSDPCFPKLHLAKASSSNYSLVIQDTHTPSNIFLTPMIDFDTTELHSKNNNDSKRVDRSWQTLTLPASIPKESGRGSMASACIIGSCNGLLCMRYFQQQKDLQLCVCNPTLGEFTILPPFREFANAGFGFCHKTKQYKVLKFGRYSRNWDILTLGIDDDWRKISDALPCPQMVAQVVYSSYKGNLHWIIDNKICCCNLETERFGYITPPSCFDDPDDFSKTLSLEIGTLDGLFCVSYKLVDGYFEVYVMEDYEVKNSWIKRIRNYAGRFDNIIFSKVRFLDNGVLLLNNYAHLVYLDTRKGTASNIYVEGDFMEYNAAVHFPSLISLKEIVRRENVEEVEQKMVHIFSSKPRKVKLSFF